MERSLSILLPVHNCQATLRRSVLRVLEIATDLTQQFDVLIVDNGSTDHTSEVAYDLAREYPQVIVRRFAAPQDLSAVVRQGLGATQGEILCLHEGDGPIHLADLRRLWELRNDELLVLARSGGSLPNLMAANVDRLLRGGTGRIPFGAGFHMLRRDSIDLARNGAALQIENQQVRLRRDLPQPNHTPVASQPNFLSRLRRLALGE